MRAKDNRLLLATIGWSKEKLSGTPRDTLYSRGKGVCEQKTTDCCLRQSVGQKRSYRGPRGILCTRGEKEHTSKRVSVIACDNVISKAKCATCGRALHIRAKVPCGHRTPKLRFGFSAAHRRHKKITTDLVVILLWCRWPDSNRHGIATGGF